MKRLNPATGRPFEKGETREDGFTFVRYLTKRPIKADGFFVEDWKNPKRKTYGEKRLNPDTQKPYDRGDFNSDKTKQFWQYVQNSSDKNGFCYETWLTPLKFKAAMKQQNNYGKKHKEETKRLAASGTLKRRLNPDTGKEFKEGERNEEGKIFATYVGQEKTKDGFVGEYWVNEKQFLRRKISQTLRHTKYRAEKKNLENNLTLEYLYEIFPKDYICPIFKTKMDWLGTSANSPSLDRIIPDLGYVEGNVAFISGAANTLKLNRTPIILRKIADFVEAQSNYEQAK